MLEENFKIIQTGEIVEGVVLDVKPEEIILNIGYKSDGILTKHEYSNESGINMMDVAKPGDTMEVKVLKVNDSEGQVLLTYKRLAADRGNKRIEEAYLNREILTATVTQVLDGGLCVMVDEVKIFIPASLVSNSYEKNLAKYAGQEIQFVISEYNPKKRRYIGDRKQILNAERAEMQRLLFERIAVGDVIEDGIVKNVTDFGAFVDIGGADGLLHISEMSWGRVENPRKHFKSGDVVRTFIKDINGSKIALSRKFPDANPGKDAMETYAVGSEITGRVARMTDFGAFIELEQGVDALLHVSQIAREHVEKPSDILKVGDIVTAKIVDFNEADRKISLSMKALLPPEEEVVETADVEVADPPVVEAAETPADTEASLVGEGLAPPAVEEAKTPAPEDAETPVVEVAETPADTEASLVGEGLAPPAVEKAKTPADAAPPAVEVAETPTEEKEEKPKKRAAKKAPASAEAPPAVEEAKTPATEEAPE
jgi:ribosomal protein S1